MYLQYKAKPQEEVSDSVGLLISILVRYPEVSTINFEPEKQELRFTFMVPKELDKNQLVNFERIVKDSIEIYTQLEGIEPSIVEMNAGKYDDFVKFEIARDVSSLSQDEIALVISLVKSHLLNDTVEGSEPIIEEELLMQEELIDQMLESLKISSTERNLIAFREEGRVLVFNK